MDRYSLSHLADQSLLAGLRRLVAQDRLTTADLLAHIAEVDRRRLYAPAGYPSMRAWCVGALGLSEDSAAKRIHVARRARQFPAIFEAIADGRLHLSAAVLLAPHLNEESAEHLLAAAAHKTKAEVEILVAEWFPEEEASDETEHAPGHVRDRSRLAPIGRDRFRLQCEIGKKDRDRIQYALELMSHRNPSGAISELIRTALDLLIPALEAQKFAATDDPRPGQPLAEGSRHVPAEVKRTVWARDGGACTFVGPDGRICRSRWMTEFDHVAAFAQGGVATVASVRVLCRAHNQMVAEQTFGGGFMEAKRQEARGVREAEQEEALEAQRLARERRAAEAAKEAQERRAGARLKERADEVIPYLRRLRFTAEEARRRALGACESLPDGSLEACVRAAISQSYASAQASGWAAAAP